MQLTDAQVAIAEAQGCRFVPATEGQVRQFSMQRRVFQVRGQPFLIMRQDGFYETAGTLMALIAHLPVPAPVPVPPAPVPAAPAPAEPAPVAVPPPAPVLAPEPEVLSEAETAPEPVAELHTEVEPEEEPVAPPDAPAEVEPLQAMLALPEPLVTRRHAPRVKAIAPPVEAPAPLSPAAQADVLSAMKTITAGYVAGHQVDAEQLSTLLTTVHRSLRDLPRPH